MVCFQPGGFSSSSGSGIGFLVGNRGDVALEWIGLAAIRASGLVTWNLIAELQCFSDVLSLLLF